MIKTTVALSCAAFAAILTAAQGQTMKTEKFPKIESPLPYQVVQRDPSTVRKDNTGSAQVAMRWTDPGPVAAYEWQVVALENAFGKGTTWASVKPSVSGDVCRVSITVPVGGWYRLELRRPGAVKLTATVEPVGIGEVFVIAGQSYADNCSDELLKVQEPQGRVCVLDPKTGVWRKADDPQPTPSTYRTGSIWPPFGDDLAKTLMVPVGLVNVAVAATSSGQWMPGQALHQNLVQAAKAVGRFRAVLWQQGESDVIGGVPAAKYVENLKTIRAALVKECGFELAWLPAKSTIHPTVYNNPKQEAVIRSAVDTLWKTPGFFPGPDTDTLTGENRGGAGSQRHFSPIGQRRAAALWVGAVTNLIAKPPLSQPKENP
ncbi:MAG: sialate O-acetylesterase [bacterium]